MPKPSSPCQRLPKQIMWIIIREKFSSSRSSRNEQCRRGTLWPPIECIIHASAVRAVDDATFDAEDRQLLFASQDAIKDRGGLFRPGLGERRVPKQSDLLVFQKIGQIVARLAQPFCAEDRH